MYIAPFQALYLYFSVLLKKPTQNHELLPGFHGLSEV